MGDILPFQRPQERPQATPQPKASPFVRPGDFMDPAIDPDEQIVRLLSRTAVHLRRLGHDLTTAMPILADLALLMFMGYSTTTDTFEPPNCTDITGQRMVGFAVDAWRRTAAGASIPDRFH